MPETKSIEFLAYSLGGAATIIAASFARKEKDKYTSCCMALVLPVVTVTMAIPFWITEALHPTIADPLLYRMDLAIGLDPVSVWRKVQHFRWMYSTLSVIYQSLPLFVGIAYALEKPRFLFQTMVAASILAFVSYNVFPAVGPAHVHNPIGMPRNCFPSMHLGWALLIAWNARGRAMRVAAWIFASLTAVATIGLGEHYFVDLIATIPFCYAVQIAAVARASHKNFVLGAVSEAD